MEGWRASPDAAVDSWLEREIAPCRFDDVRHGKRLRTLLEQLSERIGGSIPLAVRIGRPRRHPIDSFQTAGSARTRFWRGTFSARRSGSQPIAGYGDAEVAGYVARGTPLASSFLADLILLSVIHQPRRMRSKLREWPELARSH